MPKPQEEPRREFHIEHTTHDQVRWGDSGTQPPDPVWEEQRRKIHETGRLYGSQSSGNSGGERRVTMLPSSSSPSTHQQQPSTRGPPPSMRSIREEQNRMARAKSTNSTPPTTSREDRPGVGRMNTIPTRRHPLYDPSLRPSRKGTKEQEEKVKPEAEPKRKPNLAEKLRNTFRLSSLDSKSRKEEDERDERDRDRAKKHSLEKIRRHRKAIQEGKLEKVIPPNDGVEMGRRAPPRPSSGARRELRGPVGNIPPVFRDSSPFRPLSYPRSRSESRSRERTRDIERGKETYQQIVREEEEIYINPRANWKVEGNENANMSTNSSEDPARLSTSRSRTKDKLSAPSHRRDGKPSGSRDTLWPSPSPHRSSKDSKRSSHSTRLTSYIESGAAVLDETRRKLSGAFREPFDFMAYPRFLKGRHADDDDVSVESFYCRGEDVDGDVEMSSMRVGYGGEGESLWEGKPPLGCRYCKKRTALAGGLCRACNTVVDAGTEKENEEKDDDVDEWTSRVDSDEEDFDEVSSDQHIIQHTPQRHSTHRLLENDNRSRETLAMWLEEERKAKADLDALARPAPSTVGYKKNFTYGNRKVPQPDSDGIGKHVVKRDTNFYAFYDDVIGDHSGEYPNSLSVCR